MRPRPTRGDWNGNGGEGGGPAKQETEVGRRLEGPRKERHLLGRPHATPSELAGRAMMACVCGWGGGRGDGARRATQDGARCGNGEPRVAGEERAAEKGGVARLRRSGCAPHLENASGEIFFNGRDRDEHVYLTCPLRGPRRQRPEGDGRPCASITGQR